MEPQGLERDVLLAMRRFGRAPFHEIHRGFSHSEFMVMVTLDRYVHQQQKDGMGAAELAERTRTSPQALSRTLRALESKGMIERQPDPKDRRHTLIRMTDYAREDMREGQMRMKHMFEQVTQRMGEEDLRTLVSLINRMSDIMKDVQEEMGIGAQDGRCVPPCPPDDPFEEEN